ncbi:hypothetical protein [Ralstonia solanacearum]|uniref:hypothetical protein n=1 Tax=Ralstonia solanacearum TaxID=305 RepID=UPI001FFC4664|nr:hypothetical protein [Ralstonia solanacearum]
MEAFANDLQNARDASAAAGTCPRSRNGSPALASAYAQAHAARAAGGAGGHYPTALLPHPGTDLPKERPSGTPPSQENPRLCARTGAPLETLRNLLTLGVKVGTDAPKAVTQTDVYLKIADRLERALRNEPDRIRSIAVHQGRTAAKACVTAWMPRAERLRLHDNPTLLGRADGDGAQSIAGTGLIEVHRPRETLTADIESRCGSCAQPSTWPQRMPRRT